MSAAIKRTALSFSRDLEFATEDELAKKMGCNARLWPRAIIKELIDNALDACEEAGVDPEIKVGIDCESGGITVADNGPGIPPETVALLCDRALRTSTRQAYASPERGAQGNAIQTIMCLPLGMGEDSTEIRIRSRSVLHVIGLTVDRVAGTIKVDHQQKPVTCDETGATVELPWTDNFGVGQIEAGDLEKIADLVRSFAALNPHAAFRFDADDKIANRDFSLAIAARGTVTKWCGALTPAHWYSIPRLADRIRQELRRDPSITLAQFLEGFASLSSRTKRAEIARSMNLSAARLEVFLTNTGTDVDHELVASLLSLMRHASRAPKPAALGAVGKDKVADLLIADHGQRCLLDFAYHTIDGGNVPWRWEVGFAPIPEGKVRDLRMGRNFSPLVDENAFSYSLGLPYRLHSDAPVFVFLHRISPDRPFADYGKSRLSLDQEEVRALRVAIQKVAGKWIEAQEKDKLQRERAVKREADARRRAEREGNEAARRGTLALPIRRRGAKSDDQRAREDEEIRVWCRGITDLNEQIGLEVGTRGWCYLLEEHGLDKNDFDKAERLITECRKSGLLPLDIVAEDNARVFGCLEEIDNPDPIAEARGLVERIGIQHLHYHPFSFWNDQDTYIQALVEKIELRSLFKPGCSEFRIPIANGRGWADLNCRATMMRRFAHWEAKGKRCVLMYCGDHDPVGLLISDRLRSNMAELTNAVGWSPENLIIDRFGLNADLIERLGLTWIDGLSTGNSNTPNLEDPRHPDHKKPYVQDYLKRIGPRKVEASALVTRKEEARQLFRDAITSYLPTDAPARYAEKIKPSREQMRKEVVRLMAAGDAP